MSRTLLLSVLTLTALTACETTTSDPDTYVTTELTQAVELEEVAVEDSGLAEVVQEAPVVELVTVTESVDVEPVESFAIEVSANENLSLLAEWAGVTVEEVVAVNEIHPADALVVGQVLNIPLPEVQASSFNGQREAWATARLDRYLDGRGGLVGVSDYTVRTGDVAWRLARDEAGVPMWVLAAFNRGADLDRLRIGDTLRVPVLSDDVGSVSDVTDVTEVQ